ncbi:hypothetical protein BGX21_002428 [Mortierella sp. AD011]|nr:hypothetical protein BGX21_002428 [Mortierella sp. AD011]
MHARRDSAKALEHTNNAKSLLKHTEHMLASKKVKDPALSEGIANVYHEHGQLLDDMGHYDKAKKSHSKTEKWGYADIANQYTITSQPLGKSDTEAAALSFMPKTSTAMYQIITSDAMQLNRQDHVLHLNPVEVNNGKLTPNKDVVIQKLEGHRHKVTSISFSATGDRIASGSSDYTVQLWDIGTGECVHVLQGHNGVVSSVVYSPERDRFASGSWDSTVRL